MTRLAPSVESAWPNLSTEGYEIKSEKTLFSDPKCKKHYNCIAFAAGVETAWWEPDAQGFWAWPIAERKMTLDCYVNAYRSIGYEVCSGGEIELGFEKIVLYTLNDKPTHAAKQLPDGRWKSKLGQLEDIEHNTPRALENATYGTAVQYMKRSTADA